MTSAALWLVGIPVVLFLYSYLAYPFLLGVVAAFKPRPTRYGDPDRWPSISISLPAYNEERSIGVTLESLLRLDYPAGMIHVLVVSDGSTDGTDDVVRGFADRGVELLRLPRRAGKTAAENAAARRLRGEIVVNTDATIRIPPEALKPLVRAFQDPTVGAASGRDISVGNAAEEGNRGESAYVGYEMWLRGLETRIGSIVGASGCFYAIRRALVADLFPEALSRDFAAPLTAREAGFRTVSVEEAICYVPRAMSLRTEYRRKVRTMARGLETLWYKRALMNPFVYGRFAWMLISHKLCRWLGHLTLPLALAGLALLSPASPVAAGLLGLTAVGLLIGATALAWPTDRRVPIPIALCGFVVVVSIAALVAWAKALRGERNPMWEPTRRPAGTA